MDTTNLIVAIDLGSSNIVGMAGVKNGDKIKIVAVEQEPSEGALRRGAIVNIEDTTAKVRKLIQKLENNLGSRINEVYVSIGGQSVRTIKNNVSRHLPDGTKISSSLLNELHKEVRNLPISSTEIIDTLPNETFVGDTPVSNPEGMEANKIQINVLLAVARQTLPKNISTVFEKINLSIADMILSAKADAEAILTKEDKNKGCVLVNFGGGTTEVSIYCQGYLRQFTTIPLGGKNITQDIMSLGLISDEAERFKKSIGSALLSSDEQLKGIALDGQVKPKELNRVAVARIEEIVANIVNQIKESGCKSDIKGGVVITGGASLLKDLPELLRKEAGMDVRCGTISDKIELGIEINQIPPFSQAIGMLLIAGENFVPEQKEEKDGWWTRRKKAKEAERKAKEEAEQRAKEEAERKAREEEEKKREKAEKGKDKKEKGKGLFDSLRDGIIKIMDEGENEGIN